MSDPRTLIVIPARYASRRVPGKALRDLDGEPVIWHVHQRAVGAGLGKVVVATDDERIRCVVTERGGQAVITAATHRNGSERMAEVARSHPGMELFIDLQGDEPLLSPDVIVAVRERMVADAEAQVGTAITPLDDPSMLGRPSVVKAEVDERGFAIAFWRDPAHRTNPRGPVYRHLGIYAYRRDALLRYASLAPSATEQQRSLEQLRALDAGMAIAAVEVARQAVAVDTERDLGAVRRRLAAGR